MAALIKNKMKRNIKHCFCMFVMLHIVIAALSQSKIKITGRVMDDTGRPVSYASVFSVKKNLYSRSDRDGYFTLGYPVQNDDTIICSHINYYTQAYVVQGNDTLNFMLTIKHAGTAYVLYFHNSKVKPTESFKLNYYDSLKLSLRRKPRVIYGDDILSSVEFPARYRKGRDSLQTLFAQSFIIQNNFKKQSVISVRLTITKEGSLENVFLLKGIGRGEDQAVLQWCRAQLADKWYPAEQNGRKVSSTVDIQFCF